MKPTLKQALSAVALAGGFLLCGGQAALADDGIASDAGSTVQLGNASPSVGVTVCGNSVGVLGAGTEADCNGAQSSSSGGEADAQRADAGGDRDGIPSDAGSTVQLGNASPSTAMTVCGNSASVGDASSSAGCDGRRTTTSGGDPLGEPEQVADAPRETSEVAGSRAQPPPDVLGLTLARPAAEEVAGDRMRQSEPVTMLAKRSPTGHMPVTGGLIPGLGWAALFLIAGTGFLITDVLTY